jgi:hypothetical protein
MGLRQVDERPATSRALAVGIDGPRSPSEEGRATRPSNGLPGARRAASDYADLACRVVEGSLNSPLVEVMATAFSGGPVLSRDDLLPGEGA